MSTLKELIRTSNEIESQLLETGGEIDSVIEEFLSITESDLKKKIDSYDAILLRMKHLKAHYDELSERYAKISKACENVSDRLLSNIKHVMRESGEREIYGESVKFVLSHSTPSVDVFDQELLDSKYLVEKVVVSVDKKKIKEDLSLGRDVPGARLLESYALRSYVSLPRKAEKKKLES